jgi:hypothetical protein
MCCLAIYLEWLGRVDIDGSKVREVGRRGSILGDPHLTGHHQTLLYCECNLHRQTGEVTSHVKTFPALLHLVEAGEHAKAYCAEAYENDEQP